MWAHTAGAVVSECPQVRTTRLCANTILRPRESHRVRTPLGVHFREKASPRDLGGLSHRSLVCTWRYGVSFRVSAYQRISGETLAISIIVSQGLGGWVSTWTETTSKPTDQCSPDRSVRGHNKLSSQLVELRTAPLSRTQRFQRSEGVCACSFRSSQVSDSSLLTFLPCPGHARYQRHAARCCVSPGRRGSRSGGRGRRSACRAGGGCRSAGRARGAGSSAVARGLL